jgi:hypothetical protein
MPISANENVFYQEIMSAIRDKIPHHATIANTISDILDIDKDAVYRRLRGEVGFSFHEMAIIANKLGISLDNIAEIENTPSSRSTRLNLCNQINPTNADYETFERHVHILQSIKDEPGTSIMDAGNVFPYYLSLDCEHITKFYMFRWGQASSFGNPMSFHDITIPERLRAVQKNICQYARHISSTTYVFNRHLFQRCVANVKYCAQIHLLNDEDVSLIKNDMMALLNYIEKLAVKGKYPETGNEVSIYLSDIGFDANYTCLKSSNIHFTLLRVYLLNFVVGFNRDVYHETCAWIRYLQRMSTLISGSGEKIRATFFDEQRKVIDTL